MYIYIQIHVISATFTFLKVALPTSIVHTTILHIIITS